MSARSHSRTVTPLALALALVTLVGATAQAQSADWTPDSKSSLAWWQINPHMNHLWASTCPQEPSWRPGEGRSGGWTITQAFRPPKQGDAAVSDTTIIPLYPRRRARSVCTPAVTGRVQVADTTKWTGVQGWIAVRSADLNGGDNSRDAYTKQSVTEVNQFPEIRFQIDSIVRVVTRRDTVRATAVGTFTFRGVTQPMTASFRSYVDESGRRVHGKFHFPALDLIKVYGVSGFVLGMGVATRIWYDVWGGVDLVLRPTSQTNSSN
jgi:polyisoprenoid-binding protein YceI